MRVLIDALQAGNRSGTGRYTVELLRALQEQDPHVEIAATWPKALPCAIEGLRTLPHAAQGLARLFADQWQLPRLARRERFDLVHYPASIGALAPNGVRTLVTVHDCACFRHPEWFSPARSIYYRYALRRSARAATRLIADSESTAHDLEEFTGVPRERIDTIPLGVSREFAPAPGEACARLRGKLQLPERFFLYTGTLEPRKNLVRSIKAWSRNANALGFPALVITGRDGWKTGPIEQAIAHAPHRARIHRTGFVAPEDLPVLYSAAEALIWPSLFEGFGLPVLEAMACGTPVITSNTGSLPEVAGDAAYLVDPRDTEAIAEALLRIAEDPATRANLRERGLQRAACFTWKSTAQQTLQSYARACEG